MTTTTFLWLAAAIFLAVLVTRVLAMWTDSTGETFTLYAPQVIANAVYEAMVKAWKERKE